MNFSRLNRGESDAADQVLAMIKQSPGGITFPELLGEFADRPNIYCNVRHAIDLLKEKKKIKWPNGDPALHNVKIRASEDEEVEEDPEPSATLIKKITTFSFPSHLSLAG
jgi:hypothetical protein